MSKLKLHFGVVALVLVALLMGACASESGLAIKGAIDARDAGSYLFTGA